MSIPIKRISLKSFPMGNCLSFSMTFCKGSKGTKNNKPYFAFPVMDMKKIIEENWGGFSTYFGETGTKKVDWLNRLNEIRNRCFHAVRYRTNPVSPDDMEYLNGCIDRILKVATILKQKGLFYRGGN